MKTYYEDLMIDIETMATCTNAAILSIAAVEFCMETGKTGREFYYDIDLESAVQLGLSLEPSTVLWWMNQSDEARKKLHSENAVPIRKALREFYIFCKDADYRIWANSPSFDCVILKNALDKANYKTPWRFSKERDVRTLTSLFPESKEIAFKGIVHYAIDDCYHQIKMCVKAYKLIYAQAL